MVDTPDTDAKRPDTGKFVGGWLKIYRAARARNLRMLDRFSRRMAREFEIDLADGLMGGADVPAVNDHGDGSAAAAIVEGCN